MMQHLALSKFIIFRVEQTAENYRSSLRSKKNSDEVFIWVGCRRACKPLGEIAVLTSPYRLVSFNLSISSPAYFPPKGPTEFLEIIFHNFLSKMTLSNFVL